LGGWEDVEDVRIYMYLKLRSGEAEYGRKAQWPFKSPVTTSCADGGGGKVAMEEKGFMYRNKEFYGDCETKSSWWPHCSC